MKVSIETKSGERIFKESLVGRTELIVYSGLQKGDSITIESTMYIIEDKRYDILYEDLNFIVFEK